MSTVDGTGIAKHAEKEKGLYKQYSPLVYWETLVLGLHGGELEAL
jgi:hypothetical protein